MTKRKKMLIPPMKFMEDIMPREPKKRDPLDKLPLTVAEWKRLAKKLGIKWLDMNGIDLTDGIRWKFLEYTDKAGNRGTLTYTLARAIAKLGAK